MSRPLLAGQLIVQYCNSIATFINELSHITAPPEE